MTILLALFILLLISTFFVLVALFRATPAVQVLSEIMCPIPETTP